MAIRVAHVGTGNAGRIALAQLIEDPRFATAALRAKNDAELDPIIREWTMRHTKHEAMALVDLSAAVFDDDE